MPICVKEQDCARLALSRSSIGGAAINRDFGRRIAYASKTRYFEPGVFYAKDAFEGLDIMDAPDRRRRPRAQLVRARCAVEAARCA